MIPKESINDNGQIRHISDVDPKLFYKKSHLSCCKDTRARAVYSYILKQDRAGVIKHIQYINRVGDRAYKSHLWYGQDILNVLAIRDRRNECTEIIPVDPKQSIVEKILKVSTKKDIAIIVEESIKIQSENSFLQEHIKNIQGQLTDLLKKNEELTLKINTRASLEAKTTEKICEFIFNNNQKVYWFELSPEQTCGVYLLKLNGNIVYIGQSVSVPTRVNQHVSDGKLFDEVTIIPCPKDELDEKESFLIKLIKPPLNGRYKNSTDPKIIEYKHNLEKQIKEAIL